MNLLQQHCFGIPGLTSAFPLSILAGTTLTIFFKKNFQLQGHVVTRLKTATALGILWAPTIISEIPASVNAVQAGLTLVCAFREIIDFGREEQIKALVLSGCVLLPSLIPCPHVLSVLAVGCATTQFLRWPTGLKNWLREPRIIFGPAYVLLVAGAAWANFGRTASNFLLTTAALLASIAAIFLRPDNKELLERGGLPVPTTSTRKQAHGASMFLSFICLTTHSVLFQKSPVIMGVVVFGFFNSLLYLGVADFPRLCWTTISRFVKPNLNPAIFTKSFRG